MLKDEIMRIKLLRLVGEWITDFNFEKEDELGENVDDEFVDEILSLIRESLLKEKEPTEINHDFNDEYREGYNQVVKDCNKAFESIKYLLM